MNKRIFEYDNYRDFLKDRYQSLKEENPKYSFRYFSRLAGFSSSSVLKMIMDGKRNIAPQSIEKFAKALKLTKEESRFFRSLVLFNQATTADERQACAEQLLRSRELRKIAPLKELQYRYFAKWYFVLIRELVNLPTFREDSQWIATQVHPPITTQEAEKAIEELLELGLLKRDESGHLRQSDAFVTTPDEVTRSSVAGYHKEMLKRAAESIDRVAREERDLSAVTLCVSRETASKVKELARNFRQAILDLASQDQQIADSVYQVNVQIFPLAQTESEPKTSDKEEKAS